MKRTLPILMIVAAAVWCGQSLWAGGNAESSSSSQPVTLSVSASQGWIDQVDKDIAALYTAKTGVQFDWQILPANQYITVLHTKLNAGEEADIFLDQVSPVTLKGEVDPAKNAIDLTDQPWVARVDPLWKPAITVDGKVYALPMWNSGLHWVYTYNKAIFAKLNLPVPTSYAEFKSDAAAIKAAGIDPIYEAVSAGWHHVLPFAEIGAQYEKLDPGITEKLNNNTATFAGTPEFLQAVTEIQEFAKLGYFGANYLSNSLDNSYQAMATGKAAMYLGPMGYAADLINRYPNAGPLDNWGIFVEPWLNNQYMDVSVGGPLRFGYIKSPHKKQVLDYFAFSVQPDNLKTWLDKNTTGPLSVPFAGAPANANSIEQVALKRWPEGGVVLQHRVKYVDPQWMQIGKDLESMFVGTMTPMDVLKSIDKRRAEQANLQSDPSWK